MIRINLLPVRETKRRTAGQRHIFLILVAVALECLGFFYVYGTQTEDLAERAKVNNDKKQRIETLKKDVGDIGELEAEKADLEQQQRILETLEVGRQGPVKVLQELWFMLTAPADGKARAEIERRGGQPNWDPKRLWLSSFVETENQVTILGEAKSNDDVAEFLTRLSKSEYFRDVQLLWTKGRDAGAQLNNVRYVQFNVSCYVSYTGKADGGLLDLAPAGGKGTN